MRHHCLATGSSGLTGCCGRECGSNRPCNPDLALSIHSLLSLLSFQCVLDLQLNTVSEGAQGVGLSPAGPVTVSLMTWSSQTELTRLNNPFAHSISCVVSNW